MYFGQNYYSIFPQLHPILTLYNEIEHNTRLVKTAFSMECPRGCCICCAASSVNIEASVLEMLPVCIHLYETNTYRFWMNKTQTGKFPFYNANSNEAGCCSVYFYRPLVCRLFGFSFMKNKYGAIVPVACSTLKKQFNAQKETNAVSPEALPLMSTFSLQAMMIDPTIGTNRYPIDESFIKTMHYVIYKLELYQQCTLTNTDKTA